MAALLPQVGWYGLGSMGLGMATNLQHHLQSMSLPSLRFSNRTLSKGSSLQDAGAIPETDFPALVRSSNIIFTMISDDTVLYELVTKAIADGGPLDGKIFVDTSTVHPDTCESVCKLLGEHGSQFMASPVFGASPMAAAGKLIFAMAGSPTALETVRPFVIDVMARSIINMGADVRKSSLLKLSGNILVISFVEVIAEAQVFAEVSGLGTQQLEEFIGSMFGPVMESYSKRVTSGAYAPPLDTPPGFAAALATKDAKHALSIAERHGAGIPTLGLALQRLTKAREYAGESLDSSSVYGIARMEAGLPFWSENSRQGN